MPIINFSCDENHLSKKFYRSASDAPAYLVCAICSKDMKKLLSAPSSQSKITVDNGIQARSVEINLDVIEANKERANKDFRSED